MLQVAQKAGAAALCLLGTRWRGSEYVQHAHWHIFHSPVPEGATGADAHTGVMIAVSKNLSPKKPRYAQTWQRGRSMVVRVKASKGVDACFVCAYAPGEHHTDGTRARFWDRLDCGLTGLPPRSRRVMFIDANGHLGTPAHPPMCGRIGG